MKFHRLNDTRDHCPSNSHVMSLAGRMFPSRRNGLHKNKRPPASSATTSPTPELTLTAPSDDDEEEEEEKECGEEEDGGSRSSKGKGSSSVADSGCSSSGKRGGDKGGDISNFLAPDANLHRASSTTTSIRSSFRQKFSLAGSILSLYMSSPSKLLKNSMLLAALSSFLMALYGMLYGIIKDDIARATVAVTRGLLQIVLNLLFSWRLGEKFQLLDISSSISSPSLSHLWTHFSVVVVFGGLRLCLIFAALQLTEMSIVHTILNGSPVMVMILAHFILSGSERMTWLKILSALLLVAGVVLNSNPVDAVKDASQNNNFESAIGIAMAILALVFSSLGNIYTKKVSRHFSKLHIGAAIGASITVFGLLSILFDDLFSAMKVMKMNHQFLEKQDNSSTRLLSLVDQLPPLTDLSCLSSTSSNFTAADFDDCQVSSPPYFPDDLNIWTTAVVVALLGILQQFCLIAAIKMGSPTRVSMMRSSAIIFSFILQSGASSVPDWNQWLGAAVILVAIFVNVLEGTVQRKLQELKKRCCCCCLDNPRETTTTLELDHKATGTPKDKGLLP